MFWHKVWNCCPERYGKFQSEIPSTSGAICEKPQGGPLPPPPAGRGLTTSLRWLENLRRGRDTSLTLSPYSIHLQRNIVISLVWNLWLDATPGRRGLIRWGALFLRCLRCCAAGGLNRASGRWKAQLAIRNLAHLGSWLGPDSGFGSGLGNQLNARLDSARGLAKVSARGSDGALLGNRDSAWLGSGLS